MSLNIIQNLAGLISAGTTVKFCIGVGTMKERSIDWEGQ